VRLSHGIPASFPRTGVESYTQVPEDKGTYILIASVAQMKRLEIGGLGAFDLPQTYLTASIGRSPVWARRFRRKHCYLGGE
jgi:hypothetical protein